MSSSRLRFISNNDFKIGEARLILSRRKIEVVPVKKEIFELQSFDIDEIVKDKAVQAYHHVGWPLFVEHTTLNLEALGGLPGGLTNIFWQCLKAQGICDLINTIGNDRVVARSHIAYCDGRTIKLFHGELHGRVSSTPRGQSQFHWDSVFMPDGYCRTFAELGLEKHEISMRVQALEALANYIEVS